LSNLTEAQTRQNLIDDALKKAGWDLDNPNHVGEEIPVDDFSPAGCWRLASWNAPWTWCGQSAWWATAIPTPLRRPRRGGGDHDARSGAVLSCVSRVC